jgi:hypothetical protein
MADNYNLAFGMEGLPTGGRGNNQQFSALRAAANARRDLFSGSGKSNLARLGIKEGYSFTGGEGKTLVDTVTYRGSGAYDGGTLNIYKDSAAMDGGGGDDDDGGEDDGGNSGGGGPGSSPGSDGGAGETINPYQGIEFPDYSDQFSGMNDAITGLSTTFTNELSKLTGKMAEDRKAAEDRMAEMQQSFQQSLAARKSKPRVSGIRFADRGTGGRSSTQLLRRGVRGTFGRSGERLMKISALNI